MPGKPLSDPRSYREISLLTSISKLFEKLFARRLRRIIGRPSVRIQRETFNGGAGPPPDFYRTRSIEKQIILPNNGVSEYETGVG